MNNYRTEYEEVFGPLPALSGNDLPLLAKPSLEEPAALKAWVSMPQEKKEAVNRIYANMGKATEAFVRTILPLPSRFDRYVEALLKGVIGKAKCINCHSGPLITNGDFHNIGVPQPAQLPEDRGRADAISKVLADEFNCFSIYSDARPGDCGELRFLDVSVEKYIGAFKTPSLRNVAERPPYMHAGQFKSISEVLRFYQTVKPGGRVSPELEHMGLTDAEISQLEAFLRTLSGPVVAGERMP
jgi:cytochrome c peroxidase